MAELEDEIKENGKVKAEKILEVFTEEVYTQYMYWDEDEGFRMRVLDEVLRMKFKTNTTPYHYACVVNICKYVPYEISKKLLIQVKKKEDIYSYTKRLEGYIEAQYCEQSGQPNKTGKIYRSLLKLDKFVAPKEFKKKLSKIAKKHNVSDKDVNALLFMIKREDKKSNGKRKTRVISPVDPKHISEEYGIDLLDVRTSIREYAGINYTGLKRKIKLDIPSYY